ncbi:MAG TPA: ATP synthase F0 subunit B, partial [bacterium]|nr:ATP synthase F0 subunit B [bacterium]
VALLDERQRTIARAFGDIEQQRAQLAALRAEYEGHLARIDAEAEARRQAARAEGERIAAELVEDAHARAQELINKGREDLAREVAKARIEFRDEVVDAAMAVSRRLIEGRLDADLHRTLIDQYTEDLERVS